MTCVLFLCLNFSLKHVMFFWEGLGQATLWRKERKTAHFAGSNQGFSRREGEQYGVRQTKGETFLRSWGPPAEEKRRNGCSYTPEMRSISLQTEDDHTESVPFQEGSQLTETKHESKGTSSKGTAVEDWFIKPAFLSWLTQSFWVFSILKVNYSVL